MTDKIYRASIHFYSNDKDDLVSVMSEVSDALDEDQNIPAAYTTMQTLVLGMRASAVQIPVDENKFNEIVDSDMTADEKAVALFDTVTTTDVVAAELGA